MVEITLRSDYSYSHPHRDVLLQCEFTGPDRQQIKVQGLWDGGTTYRFRCALPVEGDWFFQTTCSDASNRGLHGIRGGITVVKYDGENHLFKKGWLRVSANGRYLTYGNGDPFFYLADTAWEITWKSRPDEVLRYISDRRQKGFTAIQVVVMSTQQFEEFGVKNRQGEPFFLNGDFSLLNPRYFDYLDWVVKAANDSGMVVALVPLWAGMTELHADSRFQRYALSAEQALLLARYVGARHAGSNVIWIVGGDNRYNTPQRKAFWSEFALTLKTASSGHHLA